MPHIDYVREAGSEGIELVMWLIARGAMADVAGGGASPRWRTASITCRPSNTAVGHLILENPNMTIHVALAGAGAFGIKHLDAIKLIPGVKVISLVSRELDKTQEVADKYGIPHVTTDLADSLAMKEVDAVILCTPTQMHASQTLACLAAGKHVQVEIPLCDVLKDGEAVVAAAQASGKVAMCGHTRRFNPSHQWVRQRIVKNEFHIQQMDVQTYFFRRTNMNALGQPRSWTDHLLWHHAAHTVDLFAYQAQSPIVKANAIQGPIHPTLGIAMDMSIQLRRPTAPSAR
jgi:2-hydroxy-4-carboxymuconate semialdehyde hemiacetal dehydrogenase